MALAGGARVGLGHQHHAPGRPHLRDVVHLRRRRQGHVDRDGAWREDRRQYIRREALPHDGTRRSKLGHVQLGERRRHRGGQRDASPSPMPPTAPSRIRSTASRSRSRSRARCSRRRRVSAGSGGAGVSFAPRYRRLPAAAAAILASMLCAGCGGGGGGSSTAPAPDPEASLTQLELIGKRIFFDTTLSNPAGQSCSGCHDPATAFAGNFGSTVGVPFAADRTTLGLRNTPTAMYAKFTPAFGWSPYGNAPTWPSSGGQFLDGRAASLEEQATIPFFSAGEMNLDDHVELANRLARAPYALLHGARVRPGRLFRFAGGARRGGERHRGVRAHRAVRAVLLQVRQFPPRRGAALRARAGGPSSSSAIR